jgi:hypothetical protein
MKIESLELLTLQAGDFGEHQALNRKSEGREIENRETMICFLKIRMRAFTPDHESSSKLNFNSQITLPQQIFNCSRIRSTALPTNNGGK